MVARVRPPTPISDEDLEHIGRDNPGWKVELVAGTIQMVPTGYESSVQNAHLIALLYMWGVEHGYSVTESNGGYKLPNNDVLVPDVAMISKQRAAMLTPKEREKFCPLIPDVVVELASKSDSLPAARRKCERWHREGVRYVVLIDEQSAEYWGEALADFPALDSLVRGLPSAKRS